MPRVIDWGDPVFRKWQSIREEWMGEFVEEITFIRNGYFTISSVEISGKVKHFIGQSIIG